MLRSFSVLGSRREIKWIVPVAKEGGSPQVTRKCGRKFPCMGGPCGALGQAYREWWEGLGETLERELTEHKDPLDLGAMAEV